MYLSIVVVAIVHLLCCCSRRTSEKKRRGEKRFNASRLCLSSVPDVSDEREQSDREERDCREFGDWRHKPDHARGGIDAVGT